MSELATLLEESVSRALATHADRSADVAMRAGRLPAALMAEIAALGIGNALLPEAAGGAGCSWSDVASVLRALGAAAAPLPVAEEMAGRWLIHRAGLPQPAGLVTLAPDARALVINADGTLSGAMSGVPWARHATHLVAQVSTGDDAEIVVLPVAALACEPDANLAGEPRDRLLLDAVRPSARGRATAPGIRAIGAALRAGLMAGAILGAQRRAVAYAGERQQFGKPIAAFQAIQQQLAVLAEEALAADMAARCALDSIETTDAEIWAAIAKLRVDDAAATALAIAHQVHGAIGFTREHDLHRLTTRLMSWRTEFGGTAEWSRWLAGRIGSGDELWPSIVRWSPVAAGD